MRAFAHFIVYSNVDARYDTNLVVEIKMSRPLGAESVLDTAWNKGKGLLESDQTNHHWHVRTLLSYQALAAVSLGHWPVL